MEKHRDKHNSSGDNHYNFKAMSRDHHHQQQQVMKCPLVGLSWPPRSYTCSFCKREFRSAQALGGHMNVHRRDRARLRHSSPPCHLHQTTTTTTTNSSYPYNSILKQPNFVPNLNMPPPPSSCSSSSSSTSSTSFLFGVREWRNFMEVGGRKEDQVMMKNGLDDLDGSLDLELRLGYT